jgi:N-methylhydantoinase B/oxoprolinase/acetone carboxylase alpha subunit
MSTEPISRPDPTVIAVLRYRLEAIARQVGVVMQRTAISQLLNQAYDFSTAIFDARGRMVAQAEHIPIHIGAIPHAVRAMLSRFEKERVCSTMMGVADNGFRCALRLRWQMGRQWWT